VSKNQAYIVGYEAALHRLSFEDVWNCGAQDLFPDADGDIHKDFERGHQDGTHEFYRRNMKALRWACWRAAPDTFPKPAGINDPPENG
jgi:hypothetical protein